MVSGSVVTLETSQIKESVFFVTKPLAIIAATILIKDNRRFEYYEYEGVYIIKIDGSAPDDILKLSQLGKG